MIYRLSKKTGKTYNSDGVEIPMDDNTVLFQQYRNDINNGSELITVDEIEGEQEIVRVPEKANKVAFKKELIKVGVSLTSVKQAIEAITDVTQRELLLMLWFESDDFYRNNEDLINFANVFNINSTQLDQLFINANKST